MKIAYLLETTQNKYVLLNDLSQNKHLCNDHLVQETEYCWTPEVTLIFTPYDYPSLPQR